MSRNCHHGGVGEECPSQRATACRLQGLVLDLNHTVNYNLYEVPAQCLTVVPLIMALAFCFSIRDRKNICVRVYLYTH